MSDFNERVEVAGQTLEQLLLKAFPAQAAEPNDNCAHLQELLADAPDHLVALIGVDYHDTDESGQPLQEALDELMDEYSEHFTHAVESAVKVFGPGQTQPERGSKAAQALPSELFDELQLLEFSYWVLGDRVALVFLGASTGDGDVQVALGVMVVPAAA